MVGLPGLVIKAMARSANLFVMALFTATKGCNVVIFIRGLPAW